MNMTVVPGGPPATDPHALGARRSASLMLLRDGAEGLEVLMLRRAERAADTRSGVWVFPGGVLDAADPGLAVHCAGPGDAAWSARLGLAHGGLDYAVAAIRECFEEVGLLLAHGDPAVLQALLARREACMTAPAFAAAVAGSGLRLADDALACHSHWLTPPGLAQRFDTWFFVARAPEGQQAQADGAEALELAWLPPALAMSPEHGLKLLPVTRHLLAQLAGFGTVDQALAAAQAPGLRPCLMGRLGHDERGKRPVLPHEPAWAELGRLEDAGLGHGACDLQPLRAVRLSSRVQRLTCNNGSVMTGPGTNTYLIGPEGGADLVVLDPGPLDDHTEAHLQAVLAAAGGARISHILVTHTHRDHSPAAVRLKALTGATLVGCVADHPEWQDASFVPDQEPRFGQRWLLGPACTLRALHTPGHASNHVCWLLEEEQMLFTGDHVMQGSTVVINPPDGDMAAYLHSLQALSALPLAWLAPGHGFLMDQPARALVSLIEHRLAREAKVLAALQAQPVATVPELVPAVYGDVPASRHGLAQRSLTAHLLKLQSDGRARVDEQGRWRTAGS